MRKVGLCGFLFRCSAFNFVLREYGVLLHNLGTYMMQLKAMETGWDMSLLSSLVTPLRSLRGATVKPG
jgi:hypothetical protein